MKTIIFFVLAVITMATRLPRRRQTGGNNCLYTNFHPCTGFVVCVCVCDVCNWSQHLPEFAKVRHRGLCTSDIPQKLQMMACGDQFFFLLRAHLLRPLTLSVCVAFSCV